MQLAINIVHNLLSEASKKKDKPIPKKASKAFDKLASDWANLKSDLDYLREKEVEVIRKKALALIEKAESGFEERHKKELKKLGKLQQDLLAAFKQLQINSKQVDDFIIVYRKIEGRPEYKELFERAFAKLTTRMQNKLTAIMDSMKEEKAREYLSLKVVDEGFVDKVLSVLSKVGKWAIGLFNKLKEMSSDIDAFLKVVGKTESSTSTNIVKTLLELKYDKEILRFTPKVVVPKAKPTAPPDDVPDGPDDAVKAHRAQRSPRGGVAARVKGRAKRALDDYVKQNLAANGKNYKALIEDLVKQGYARNQAIWAVYARRKELGLVKIKGARRIN